MIDLYTWATPNGRKISILLEELKIRYKVIPINIKCRICVVVTQSHLYVGWWGVCCFVGIGLYSVYFNNIVESCVWSFGLCKSKTCFSIRQSVCLEYRSIIAFECNRKRIVRVRNACYTCCEREFVRAERGCIGRCWSHISFCVWRDNRCSKFQLVGKSSILRLGKWKRRGSLSFCELVCRQRSSIVPTKIRVERIVCVGNGW